MGARENKVETYLDDCVTKLGGITRKWVSPGYDGVPDRIVILKGAVWFVEVKVTGGIYGPGQEREHARLRTAGMNVCTVYGRSGVDEFMKEVMQ